MKKIITVSVLCSLVLAGCTTYYQVIDPTTRKSYYTTDYESKRSGATTFVDARSGAEVTIQNSEITEITKGMYEAGLRAEPTPVPAAPAPPIAPAKPAPPATPPAPAK